ncbi:MAG: CDP-diacylglycerol--glycerol-3-phosphate 3-phosphatidyltransferase [Clostridia bacterium]|nr:CDP-diacylglycerol--glycerol-3-phosphate 3-phosphatidyltransferase [Clostridia bacterium]
MNTPNKLSFLRIILVPLIYVFYLLPIDPYGKFVAVALFILAALTDQLDGHLARKNNQVTDLGKLLDPMADKLLYCGCMFLIVLLDINGAIAHPWGIIGLFIIFARDTLINGIRQVAATKGVVVAAVLSGKLKAIFAYICIPLFMFHTAWLSIGSTAQWFVICGDIVMWLAYIMYAITIAVTIWSAIDYTVKNRAVFANAEQPKLTETEDKQNTKEEEK